MEREREMREIKLKRNEMDRQISQREKLSLKKGIARAKMTRCPQSELIKSAYSLHDNINPNKKKKSATY